MRSLYSRFAATGRMRSASSAVGVMNSSATTKKSSFLSALYVSEAFAYVIMGLLPKMRPAFTGYGSPFRIVFMASWLGTMLAPVEILYWLPIGVFWVLFESLKRPNSNPPNVGTDPGKYSPPGMSRFPVMALMIAMARRVWKELLVWSRAFPHWIAADFAVANILAARSIWSLGTQVLSATLSGV